MEQVNGAEGLSPTLFETVILDVKDIQRPKRNANKMTDFMFRSLVEGIKKDGFLYPVIVRKEDKRIIDGDHRYQAAVELGMEKVNAIVLDVSEEQAVRIGIALNQKKGYFDYMELKDMLTEIMPKIDDVSALSMDLGFTDIELNRLLSDSTVDTDKLLKEKLLGAGVNPAQIDAMTEISRTGNFQELPESKIVGKQENLRFPIVFFFNNEEEFKMVDAFFKTEGTREPDSTKLVEIVKEIQGELKTENA